MEGNVVENWKRWKQDFNFYLVATESDTKSDKIKSSLLLHCIGEKCREIYNTLAFDNEEDKLVYASIIEKFEAYLAPKKNTLSNSK